jgi:hypothetical protein
MAIDKKVDEILIEFGIRLQTDLQKSLASKMSDGYNPRLSGKIKSEPIKHMGDLTQYILSMPLYGKALDKGRGPTTKGGNGSVKKGIAEWLRRRNDIFKKFEKGNMEYRLAQQAKNKKTSRPSKPLKPLKFEKAIKQFSYLIARKIHREGYKGNQFFSEVINDGRLEQLEKDLIEATQNEVLIEIKKDFK